MVSKKNKKKNNAPKEFNPVDFVPPGDRPALYLKCSCKCKKNEFEIGPIKATGLEIVNCHCEPCRMHAGAAWAAWLTNGGEAFSMSTDLKWKKGGKEKDLLIVRVPCGSRKAFLLKKKRESQNYEEEESADLSTTTSEKKEKMEQTPGSASSSATNPGSPSSPKRTRSANSSGSSTKPKEFINLSQAGDKYLCRHCYSNMFFRLDAEEDFFVPAMGAVDDGDYPVDEVGRVDNQTLWPSDTYPDILHPKSIKFYDSCVAEKGNWYIKQARCPKKTEKLREKRFKNLSIEKLYRKIESVDADSVPAEEFFAPLTDGSIGSSAQSEGLKHENLPEVSGSCLCGACTFECIAMPGELQHCYCSMCRKNSGSAFQTWASCENKMIRWMDKSDKKLEVISEEGQSDTEDPNSKKVGKKPTEDKKIGKKASNKLNQPRALALLKTSDEGARHYCTDCGTNLSIVYDDEADTTTWIAAGLYSNKNPGTMEIKDSDDDNGIVYPKGRDSSGGDSSPTTAPAEYTPEKNSSKAPQSPKTDSKSENKGILTSKYFEKRIYYVAHICCASLQPWYKIPGDVGTERIMDAC